MDNDDLNPARGIILGLVLGTVIWIGVLLVML